jgi:hypothetical protein
VKGATATMSEPTAVEPATATEESTTTVVTAPTTLETLRDYRRPMLPAEWRGQMHRPGLLPNRREES